MELRNNSILLISPEPWGLNFVSKHNYAMALAKRSNNVFFLNPPSNGFSIERVAEYLTIVNYKPKYVGLSYLPTALSSRLIAKQVEIIELKCNTKFEIIWNFDSSSFFNLSRVVNKFRISHIVDYSENKNLKLSNSTADLCLCTSNYILKRQKMFNSNSFNIGHGYASSSEVLSTDYLLNPRSIKVGYLGNMLLKYIDWNLIITLVNEHPEIDFYFAGPIAKSNLAGQGRVPAAITLLKTNNNVNFLNEIEYNKTDSFLRQMDILLVVYNQDYDESQLANPHKILKYIGSGKIVLATFTSEYTQSTLIEMAKDRKQFLTKFDNIVQNITFHNSSNNQKIRINYAKSNSYETKIQEIERLIGS